jgi:hypothetical protein
MPSQTSLYIIACFVIHTIKSDIVFQSEDPDYIKAKYKFIDKPKALKIMNSKGKISENYFEFDLNKVSLTVELNQKNKNQDLCMITYYYESEKDLSLVYMPDKPKDETNINIDDIIIPIKKGKNIMTQITVGLLLDKGNIISECQELNNTDITGVSEINKFYENNKKNKLMKYFTNIGDYGIKAYKYHFRKFKPNQFYEIQKKNVVNEKILTFLKNFKSNQNTPLSNKYTVEKIIEDLKKSFEKWNKKKIEFCKKNNLNEGI